MLVCVIWSACHMPSFLGKGCCWLWLCWNDHVWWKNRCCQSLIVSSQLHSLSGSASALSLPLLGILRLCNMCCFAIASAFGLASASAFALHMHSVLLLWQHSLCGHAIASAWYLSLIISCCFAIASANALHLLLFLPFALHLLFVLLLCQHSLCGLFCGTCETWREVCISKAAFASCVFANLIIC